MDPGWGQKPEGFSQKFLGMNLWVEGMILPVQAAFVLHFWVVKLPPCATWVWCTVPEKDNLYLF